MKSCSECKGIMVERSAKTPEGISYNYFKCDKCGEEIVDMNQLHNVAEKYRIMKRYLFILSFSKITSNKGIKKVVKIRNLH